MILDGLARRRVGPRRSPLFLVITLLPYGSNSFKSAIVATYVNIRPEFAKDDDLKNLAYQSTSRHN